MSDRPWSTPSDLESQIERLWTRGRLLAARLGQDSVAFPFPLRLARPDTRALSERFDDVRRWIRALEDGSKAARGFGYEIVWDEVNHRQIGRNRVPAGAVVPTEADALALLGKTRAAERFTRTADAALAEFPELRAWLGKHPFAVLEGDERDFHRVLAVLRWFRAHPRPLLYVRQLEIPEVDTKFIETRKGLFCELLDLVLPADAVNAAATGARNFEARYGLLQKPALVRFRILDPALRLGPLSDIATPAAEFARLELPVRRVFITENEVNGLSLPPLPESLVVFGLGYGLDRLAEVPWLRAKAVYYWGDIDTHGFAMLDRVRSALPEARSLLMDSDTFYGHRPLWTREPVQHEGELPRLLAEERALYEALKRGDATGMRLEQERVGYGRVRQALSGAL
jgi:hypothetical protein